MAVADIEFGVPRNYLPLYGLLVSSVQMCNGQSRAWLAAPGRNLTCTFVYRG
jgi:hypothetical protein